MMFLLKSVSHLLPSAPMHTPKLATENTIDIFSCVTPRFSSRSNNVGPKMPNRIA